MNKRNLQVATLAGMLALLLAAPAANAARVSVGAYIPGTTGDPSLIDWYGNQVGNSAVIVASYKDWRRAPFDSGELDAVWNRGAVPMVTWEPWSWSNTSQYFPLQLIARGAYDDYIGDSARAAATWGRPILVRFAHEMNGGWYPWGSGVNRNTVRDYKAAWRHVVSAFRAEGANNVRWVWTPYVNQGGGLPFKRFYPGNRWVDWVGLDGFNWAVGGKWLSFRRIFTRSYRALVRMTSRPIVIAETGSQERGGSKAAWVTNALRRAIPRLTHIRAIVWWSVKDPRGDLRVDSSSAALDALRAALSATKYQSNRGLFLGTPPRLRARPFARDRRP
jgi:hypothetical protein